MPFELPVEISGFGAATPCVANENVVEQFNNNIRAAVAAGDGFGGNRVDWRIIRAFGLDS